MSGWRRTGIRSVPRRQPGAIAALVRAVTADRTARAIIAGRAGHAIDSASNRAAHSTDAARAGGSAFANTAARALRVAPIASHALSTGSSCGQGSPHVGRGAEGSSHSTSRCKEQQERPTTPSQGFRAMTESFGVGRHGRHGPIRSLRVPRFYLIASCSGHSQADVGAAGARTPTAHDADGDPAARAAMARSWQAFARAPSAGNGKHGGKGHRT